MGRECWRVDLIPPAHKTGLLSLWIDAATGIRLRVESSAFGLLEELVELELDGPVDPLEFVYDGPVDRSQQEARDRDAAARDHYEDNPPPVPTVWPRGVGFHVWEGDTTTGSYVVSLNVPGSALLARHPSAGLDRDPPRSSRHRFTGGKTTHGGGPSSSSEVSSRLTSYEQSSRASRRTDGPSGPAGAEWHDPGVASLTSSSRRLDQGGPRRAPGMTERAGLGRWRPHELRHSAASLLSAAGVPLERLPTCSGTPAPG